MADPLTVVIDITDWLDESAQKELELVAESDITNRLADGRGTGEIARIAAANRESGLASEDILPPNKLAYYAGLRRAVARRAQRAVVQVELEGGKRITVPGFVGRVQSMTDGDEDGDAEPVDAGPSYVASSTVLALERAERYLTNIVPGHVYNHLKIIAAAGGDVRAMVERVKAQIDECGGRLY